MKKLLQSRAKIVKPDPFAYIVYGIVIAILTVVFVFQYLVTNPAFQTYDNLMWYRRLLYFDYMFLLFFTMTFIIGGGGLAILGYGINKKIGIVFLTTGIGMFCIGFYYFDQIFNRPQLPSCIYEALIAVFATIAGFATALLVSFVFVSRKLKVREKGV